MELNNIVNTVNINVEQLQKGLKHIGLNLSTLHMIRCICCQTPVSHLQK